MTNESAVREALHDLAMGQPAAPVDRFRTVQGRHLRRRTTQFGTVAALTALVAVGATLIPSPLKNAFESANKSSTSWMLPWPARYDGTISPSEAASTQKAALLDYERNHRLAIHDPRTLYVGTPSSTDVQWVVVEGATGEPTENGAPPAHQLIALASPDRGLSWRPYVSAAPASTTPVIGFDWASGRSGHFLFVLGSPSLRDADVVYFQDSGGVGYGGMNPVTNGVGVAPIPHRTAPGEEFVTVLNSLTAFPAVYPEGTAREGRLTRWQTALRSPPFGGRRLVFLAGVGTGDGESATAVVPRNGTITVSIKCLGPDPVRLTVYDGTRRAASSQPQCRDNSGAVDGQETMLVHRGDRLQVFTRVSQLTYFAIGVYLA